MVFFHLCDSQSNMSWKLKMKLKIRSQDERRKDILGEPTLETTSCDPVARWHALLQDAIEWVTQRLSLPLEKKMTPLSLKFITNDWHKQAHSGAVMPLSVGAPECWRSGVCSWAETGKSSSATSTQLSSSLPTTGVTHPNATFTLAPGENETGEEEWKRKPDVFFFLWRK